MPDAVLMCGIRHVIAPLHLICVADVVSRVYRHPAGTYQGGPENVAGKSGIQEMLQRGISWSAV